MRMISEAADRLIGTRPTAVNLSWAVRRILRRAETFLASRPQAGMADILDAIFQEARSIWQEDIDACLGIGLRGCHLIEEGMGVLTHCNAGALATAGQGTALSIIYQAHKAGRSFTVYVDETRPLLQGARLTAWELAQAKIRTVVICDNMAGWLMKQGKVQMVLTGADRIAANGDAANKIGTYTLAVLAARHKVPFYIAAPLSTFDPSIASGCEIPIETRPVEEIRQIHGKDLIPAVVELWNPAFDVTEAALITGIITEAGIIRRPNASRIAAFFDRLVSIRPRRP
jgi:methylthioribose-1-phosphate isomerase